MPGGSLIWCQHSIDKRFDGHFVKHQLIEEAKYAAIKLFCILPICCKNLLWIYDAPWPLAIRGYSFQFEVFNNFLPRRKIGIPLSHFWNFGKFQNIEGRMILVVIAPAQWWFWCISNFFEGNILGLIQLVGVWLQPLANINSNYFRKLMFGGHLHAMAASRPISHQLCHKTTSPQPQPQPSPPPLP